MLSDSPYFEQKYSGFKILMYEEKAKKFSRVIFGKECFSKA